MRATAIKTMVQTMVKEREVSRLQDEINELSKKVRLAEEVASSAREIEFERVDEWCAILSQMEYGKEDIRIRRREARQEAREMVQMVFDL